MQGFFFAPADLPQFGMNVTTLLVPLFALTALGLGIVWLGILWQKHEARITRRVQQFLCPRPAAH